MAGTILLIGIDEAARERLAATLREVGCSVALHGAAVAEDVERYVATEPAPALVLLAEDLAGESSLPVLDALRAHVDLDRVPVVIVGDRAHGGGHDRGYAALGSAVLEPSCDAGAYRLAITRLAERFLTDWLPARPADAGGRW